MGHSRDPRYLDWDGGVIESRGLRLGWLSVLVWPWSLRCWKCHTSEVFVPLHWVCGMAIACIQCWEEMSLADRLSAIKERHPESTGVCVRQEWAEQKGGPDVCPGALGDNDPERWAYRCEHRQAARS